MNRNKKLKKTMALAMTGALMIGQNAVPVLAQETGTEVTKDETVYIKTDANGEAQEIIVSDWLKNTDGSSELSDSTDLSDIENVKGDETFTQDGDQLVWNTDGGDIYYQGTTTKDLPFSVRVTYYLDGAEIAPDDLAGKSGHVKICYTYENHSKSGEVYTPFTMVTGMVLPADNFTNVEVTNGRVISDGSNNIVIGIGLPGLSESLKLSDTEMLKDIEIPTSFEVEADATDFKLTLAMTAAAPLTMDDLGLEDIEDMDDLKDSINELTDAATQLVDGSGDLADGVQTLKDSCQDLIDGMNTIDENMGKLNDGITTLNSKKADLISGINELVDGIDTLNESKGTLVSGVSALYTGSTSLRKGAASLQSGSKTLSQSSKLLASGAKELASGDGTKKLKAGSASLASGSKTLATGAVQLQTGVKSLVDQVPTMVEGSASLVSGAAALASGSESAATGAAALQEGIKQYTTGADALAAGVSAFVGTEEQPGASTYLATVNGILAAQLDTTAETPATTTENAAETVATYSASESAGTQSVQTISTDALDNLNTVLANLQEVQAQINGVTDPKELVTLAASYQSYVAELNECVTLLQSAIGSVEEETVSEAAAPVTLAASGEDAATQAMAAQIQAQVVAQMKNDYVLIPKSSAQQLLASGQQLAGYTTALSDGAAALLAADSETQATASDQLNAGAASLATGTTALQTGAAQLSAGMTQLDTGIGALASGADSLKSGVDALASGAASVSSGAAALDTGLGTLISGAGTLSTNLTKFDLGVDSLYSGTKELYAGTKTLESGAQQLDAGAATLSDGVGQLAEGGSKLRSGAATLGDGVEELADGSSKLKDGTKELAEGGTSLDEGVDELLEGANDLAEGMDEFNEEGIKKITDFLDEDVQDIIDRLEAVKDAGEAYQLFSASDGDTNGKVKFVIETGSIG
jgi:putative membrane protein